MPTVYKRVQALGREPIPKFARYATLCWQYPFGATAAAEFPEAQTIYNIAALAFYPRRSASGGISVVAASPTSITFWAVNDSQGVSNLYGVTRISVPHHSEWFSVAWLRLPATNLDDAGPFYEDIFKVRWELAL